MIAEEKREKRKVKRNGQIQFANWICYFEEG